MTRFRWITHIRGLAGKNIWINRDMAIQGIRLRRVKGRRRVYMKYRKDNNQQDISKSPKNLRS